MYSSFIRRSVSTLIEISGISIVKPLAFNSTKYSKTLKIGSQARTFQIIRKYSSRNFPIYENDDPEFDDKEKEVLNLRVTKKRRKRKFSDDGNKIDKSKTIAKIEMPDGRKLAYKKLLSDSMLLTKMVRETQMRKKQAENGLIMLEGWRLIQEALNAEFSLEMIAFSRKCLIKRLNFPHYYFTHYDIQNSIHLYHFPYRSIKMWSELSTSPGIIGIFKMPSLSQKQVSATSLPITIICDNVREPGNLGAILRVAAGVKAAKVILTSGCVDLWNGKVTRGSCGCHFQMPVLHNIPWEQISRECANSTVIIADHRTIEPGQLFSTKRRAEDVIDESELNDENDDDDDTIVRGTIPDPEGERMIKWHGQLKSYDVPLVPYHDVSYDALPKPLTIVIGGETEGYSEESFRFTSENKGIRVNIPLAERVDSLNSSTALAIITFEIRRQLTTNEKPQKI